MEVTMLGTANPCPQIERAGTGIAVSVADDTVLVDCGPWVTYRLVEYEINFAEIEDLFFTHHHMDHNVSFFHFALVSWYMGRRDLTVYGPDGTRDLINGFETAYEKHIKDVTQWRHAPPDGLTDIDVRNLSDDFALQRDGWEVTALPVEHAYTMETYAYRFEETETGDAFVFSGDTKKLDRVAEFARDADVLVHECNLTGKTETPLNDDEVHERYTQSPFDEYFSWVFGDNTQEELGENLHTSPAEAGEIAAAADVDTLLLTHLNPKRDPEGIRAEAEATFDGTVRVASDGFQITP